jgi:two-component system chemotaxis response regulator CheY
MKASKDYSPPGQAGLHFDEYANAMKTLIVEDDFTSRLLMQEYLKGYGPLHIAVNGREAVEAVRAALEIRQPYDLICLDIMMPEMDGQEALKEIRLLEDTRGIGTADRAKIIMTTTLADETNLLRARVQGCDYFFVKPVQRSRLLAELRKLALID